MEGLIPIKSENDRQLVSARDLYKGLGLKIRFSLWVSKNFDSFEENQDFTSVSTDTVVNNGARKPIKDYLLTLDMAKELCMMSKTEKGKQIRKYFIQVEKDWNSPDKVMERALSIAHARVAKLESKTKELGMQLEQANKKASYLDVILGTTDSLVTTQIAMDYGYSAKEFNKILHKLGIQHKVNGQWILYRIYMGKKYTTTKLYPYKDKAGKDHVKPLTAWTQKGRRLIYDVLKENGILPLIERDDVA